VFTTDDSRVQLQRASLRTTTSDSEQFSDQPALRSITRGGLRRLMHSTEEADAILAMTPRGTAKVLKAFDANRETAMRPDLGDYQIVHFATHGFFNSERPELSGIVLTMVQPDGSKINGFMALPDIYKLNLSAQLVVASACDTALGKDIKGEGLVGLTRGFMHAGSKSVVTSLWKVEDRATAALMKHFYEFMLRGKMPPAAALRAAKQELRKDRAFSAPFFWAGFTLQGEYKDPIVTSSDPSPPLLAALLAVVFSSAGLIILQRRRRVRLLHKKI
ncbi:MAG TPA: CHAT domain-containing protein, partial [Pyrinomonadaceae bacterium]|nr:CHAT domain-containing protein [Pyrinomonadaceae bacterium]